METIEKRLEVTQGSWAVLSVRLCAKYPILTQSDVEFAPGKRAAMLKNLAVTLGVSQDEITRIISKL